ncbi:MAG: DUF1667 domain-containing protein [Clostridiales bacterium]|nr:DUF1667 domain-containing protein [Clostridiales bacterium]
MTKRELTCIACPIGCAITVSLDDNKNVTDVTGNTCKRGDAYARSECTAPTRSLTSTIRVEGGKEYVVPVKSSGPVPKEMLFDCMKVINSSSIKAPVKIGDVAIKNILDTGVDIVATNTAE